MTTKELKNNIRSEIYHESWEDKMGIQVIDIVTAMKIIDKELRKFNKENNDGNNT